jgi:hypothetical protein
LQIKIDVIEYRIYETLGDSSSQQKADLKLLLGKKR